MHIWPVVIRVSNIIPNIWKHKSVQQKKNARINIDQREIRYKHAI